MAKKFKTIRGHRVEVRDATQDLTSVMFADSEGKVWMRVPGHPPAPVTFSRSMEGMRKRIQQAPMIVAMKAPPKKKSKRGPTPRKKRRKTQRADSREKGR